MKIGVLKETTKGEKRVALVPKAVKKLTNMQKFEVIIEDCAGLAAGFSNEDYKAAGADILPSNDIYNQADILVKVEAPNDAEIAQIRANSVLISLLSPFIKAQEIKSLAKQEVSAFAMEFVPRISRAQSMDVLSSQANIVGYKAALLAANNLDKVMPLLMTAAGTIAAAKVLVIGAGVAGLQAIATFKRLGAVVYAYDARSAVKEQVQSLGARFVDIDIDTQAEGQGGYAKELSSDTLSIQQQELAKIVKNMDAVVTTAAVPGRKAPLLITKEALMTMKSGSVIVDLGVKSGGNVQGSKVGEVVNIDGVSIYGPDNLASDIAKDASFVYANNIVAFLQLLVKDNEIKLDFDDEIIKQSCVCHQGNVVNDLLK